MCIPTSPPYRRADLGTSEGVSCLLSPLATQRKAQGSGASCSCTAGALEARLGLCLLPPVPTAGQPSPPGPPHLWEVGVLGTDKLRPRDQRCEIKVSVGLVPSEALRESTPGLSPAYGTCHRPGLASIPTWAFPCLCLSVCLWWTPLLIRTPVTGFTAYPSWHDLIFTNLICQDHISKGGHMLTFQVDVNLGRTLFTQDSASGAEGTGPRPQGRCIQGLPPAWPGSTGPHPAWTSCLQPTSWILAS